MERNLIENDLRNILFFVFVFFVFFLAINWKDQADNIYYLRPARYTVQVGRAVAKLIDLLVETKNADPKRIHLIGHSLGAHIMGYAGAYTKYRVGRITGKYFLRRYYFFPTKDQTAY